MYTLLNNALNDSIFSGTNIDLKLGNSSQPAIEAILNALQLIYHFNKNNIDIRSYISSYFQHSKLLQFQNNIVLNSNMDCVYGLYVATTYFYEDSIGVKDMSRGPSSANSTVLSVKPGDTCKPITAILNKTSSSAIISALCFSKPTTCGIAIKTPASALFLKNTCFRCSADLCNTLTKGCK